MEEINHACTPRSVKPAGEIASEDFARNLELQARVDTYLVLLLFVAFFRKTQKVSRTDRRWLRFHLFAAENAGAFQAENLRGRYLETTELAARYTEFLDTLNGMRRVDEIRRFRSLDYGAKKERVLALMTALGAIRHGVFFSPAMPLHSGMCSCTRSANLRAFRHESGIFWIVLFPPAFDKTASIHLAHSRKTRHVELGHVLFRLPSSCIC